MTETVGWVLVGVGLALFVLMLWAQCKVAKDADRKAGGRDE